MNLTRESVETGKQNTMEIPITEAQYNDWREGERTIWDAFPELNDEQIHFILTGITPEEAAQIQSETLEELDLELAEDESQQAYA